MRLFDKIFLVGALFMATSFAKDQSRDGEFLFKAFITESRLKISSEGEGDSTLLILKLTNEGKKTMLVSKYVSPKILVRDAEGDWLHTVTYNDSVIPPEPARDFVLLPAESSTYIEIQCTVHLLGGIPIFGGRNINGEYWYVKIAPGHYQVSLRYQVKSSTVINLPNGGGAPLWTGDITSNPVDLEVLH